MDYFVHGQSIYFAQTIQRKFPSSSPNATKQNTLKGIMYKYKYKININICKINN
jgi:hypothetical protein